MRGTVHSPLLFHPAITDYTKKVDYLKELYFSSLFIFDIHVANPTVLKLKNLHVGTSYGSSVF